MRDKLRDLQRYTGAHAARGFFEGMARLGQLHPHADPARHGVEVLRDIPYQPGGLREHTLDVYRPTTPGPHPALLYVHGGGFRILSKETHWIMGLAFARRGFAVFNIGYRLAPQHPYPAAIQDACAAYAWVVQNAYRWDADPQHLVVAGESAGANLALSLAVAACFERPEPWAKAVFDSGVVPGAVLPACGLLQVTDPERFRRRKPKLSRFVEDRVSEVSHAYVGKDAVPGGAGLDLADPLLLLEGNTQPQRPLPPMFVPVGTADVLLDDTRRLGIALRHRGAVCETAYYPKEVHAFHAFVMREAAQKCWRDTFDFLQRQGMAVAPAPKVRTARGWPR